MESELESRVCRQLSLGSRELREDTDEPISRILNDNSICSSNGSSQIYEACSDSLPYPFPLIKNQRLENPKNILIGHLNVNS